MPEERPEPTFSAAPPTKGRKGAAWDRDWTQGSIARNLLLLAWPVIVSSIVGQFDMIVDMVWVARLGAGAVAGVGVAGTLTMLISMLRMGLTTGQRAMISRAVGADDIEAANHVTMQSFLVNVIYAAIAIVVGIVLAEPMMRLMGVEAEVVRQGANYLRIAMFSQAAMSFRMTAEASMAASGDTVTPMNITMVTRAFHIILAPFLIFGWGFLPRLEVSGAALANALTAGIGAAVAIWVLTSGRTRIHMRLTWRFSRLVIWEMLRIGFPASINSAGGSIARTFITRILTTFGTYGVAASVIAGRVDMIVDLMSGGMGQAAGVLVGQNLGAGRPDRSYRSAWTAMGYGSLASLIMFTLVFWQAESVVRIFNSDPELVRVASLYIRIASLDFVAMCGASIFSQALNTAGDTIATLVVGIVAIWGIQLPLSYILPKITGWGLYSLAVATIISSLVRVIIYIAYWQWGKWREKQVRFEAGEPMRFGGGRGMH